MPDPTIPGEVPASEPLWRLVSLLDTRDTFLGHHAAGEVDLSPDALHWLHCTVLAYRAAIAARVTAEAWPAALRALNAGTSYERVASALGLGSGELAEALGGWADEQLAAGRFTPTQHAEVLALIDGSDPR